MSKVVRSARLLDGAQRSLEGPEALHLHPRAHHLVRVGCSGGCDFGNNGRRNQLHHAQVRHALAFPLRQPPLHVLVHLRAAGTGHETMHSDA